MRLNQFMLTVVSPTARLRPNQFLPLPAAATLGGRLVATLMLFAADLAASEPPRAAVFREPSPGHDETLARIIANQVSAAGYAVSFINTASLTNTSTLSPKQFDLLVLPGARSLPAVAAPAVESFLQAGGNLLALGLPAWEQAVFDLNGRWVSRADFNAALATVKPERILFDFGQDDDLRLWQRTSNDPSIPTRHEIVAAQNGKALHVDIGKLTGWDTFMSPPLTNAYAPGQTLTCFRAKGGSHTKQLALECTETDGSRWIATVALTPEWRSYALTPAAFKAWEPPPARRGEQDCFQPRNAARFVVGLAHTHTAVEGERQEYWFADLGTATSPFGDASLPDEIKLPHLESFAPGYQFFPIATNVLVYEASGTQAPRQRSKADPAETAPLLGLHPRPRGVGFNQERPFRWEPLLTAHDSTNDDYRGAIAALMVHVQPPYRGGVWAVFTPSAADFYQQPLVKNCLQQTLDRMRRGVFLVEGGAEFFTVFENQTFSVGARIVNLGANAATNLSLALELDTSPPGGRRVLKATSLRLAPDQTATVETQARLRNSAESVVRVTLRADGEWLDGLSHEIGLWRPKTNPAFIEARAGGFWQRGQPWKAHGVNYMPSSGIGLANQQHFEHWVGRGAYDPEIIGRDLRRIKAMNLNAVSVFIYHESLGAQHLLDFLRRCEELDLHVNLSLRPGTPLDFRWNEMKGLIEHYRLAQNDTVFAYDLAWEPSHGGHPQQQQTYQTAWAEWVETHIGQRGAVEKAWGTNVVGSSDAQSPAVPPTAWLLQDGPWRQCVADYRRFLDDFLRAKYAEARRRVKSIDPNHAVSFRMQHAGDPTFNWDAFLPYDFYSLTDAVDIWEPEAYGRIGDWEKVKPGRFTAGYARLCDSGKPLVWAEMGVSVWDPLSMSPAPEKLEFAASYYRDFYRMLEASDANGVFFWWYPGGYRLNERSDFGIINPDGTDRSITTIIRTEGAKFLLSHPAARKPNYWIAVDRDRDARGLLGIYEAAKAEYWQAIAAGKSPGLKWAKRPGQPAPEP